MSTSIEWTDVTINPLLVKRADGKLGHYCRKISAGCAGCYAETFNLRDLPNRGTGLPYVEGSLEQLEPYFHRPVLEAMSRWRKRRMVFACSMTDMFLSIWPSAWIQECLTAFADAADRGHVIQILTKRPARMVEEVSSWFDRTDRLVPQNLWLGISAEVQVNFDTRWAQINRLRRVTNGPLWCSYEPALGPIDFDEALFWDNLDWIVVGGESGVKARPFDPAWALSAIGQCRARLTPVFVKQMGRRPVGLKLKDTKGGDPAEWPEVLRVREMPERAP